MTTLSGLTLPCCLSDDEIAGLLREDVPYLDLTTHALGIGDAPGTITFAARQPTVIAATEEAGRLLTQCGATVTMALPSGSRVRLGELVLMATGPAHALHRGWKVAVNLLEYVSGIATRTYALVAAARQVNPRVTVATTRKVFPGTRALAVKGILAGGAVPHRLGLSESILIFPQHRAFLGGLDGLCEALRRLKQTGREHKVGVEVEGLDDALAVAEAGADLLQFDKLPAAELQAAVGALRPRFPALTLVAAGGLTATNIAAYAATGVDVLATTWPYSGPPADIGVSISRGEPGVGASAPPGC
ncbi:MAG: ModD protein [Chloroflexales bacterium]|nr:ModD protein [Chloroflexales bacterium]